MGIIVLFLPITANGRCDFLTKKLDNDSNVENLIQQTKNSIASEQLQNSYRLNYNYTDYSCNKGTQLKDCPTPIWDHFAEERAEESYCSQSENNSSINTKVKPQKTQETPVAKSAPKKEEKSKVTSVTKYKNVELNNLEQAKRLIGMESSVSASSCTITAKNKLINGKSQDLVTCETIPTREKYQFEFDDLSDPDNSENGTVYKSLQAYFCTNSINDMCMKRVKDVWGGDASAGQKKPDEPKKETEKINKYSNLQLHDLNQA